MTDLYLDTHVWRDYFEDRVDKMRPLGEFAFNVLRRAINCEFTILTSTVVTRELQKEYSKEEIESHMFEQLRKVNKLKIVNLKKEQFKRAGEISEERGIPLNDAIHAVLAKDNGALLVSRDGHHEQVRDMVDVRKPEEL